MTIPTPKNVRLEALREANFDIASNLGTTIWKAHYSKIISMGQIDYMLAVRFASDNLRRYLNSTKLWFEILWQGERPIGYCSYGLTVSPGEMKLEQIYLLEEFRGNGFGVFMLLHIESEAHKKNIQTLILQVNKRNESSIAFYRKAGYQIREEAVFDIGNGYFMDDYVMEKVI